MLAACLVLAALPLRRAAAQVPCACAGRSPEVPSVAREVRLEDVDMIAAIGDSDTAAFAAGSSSLLEYATEFWGVSFSTGGQPAAARPLEAGAARHGRGLGDLAQPRQPGARLQPGPGGRQRGQRAAGTRRPGPRPQRGGQVRLLLARPGQVTASVLSGDWAGGAAAQAEQLVARVAGVEGSRDKWKLVTVYLGGEMWHTGKWCLSPLTAPGNDICLYSCGTWWAQGDASPEAYKVVCRVLAVYIIMILPE